MKHLSALFAGSLTLLISCCAAYAAPDALRAGFQSPPESAKPQTWWHWMNGNVTKAGITADLEAMKKIGLGGATIVNVDCGIPAGSVAFMSDEWREDFKFAVQEANRLGLKLCIANCAGWSNSGGPWITPDNGMQCLTSSETLAHGPIAIDLPLPQPATKLGHYRDIAVLAFRVPAKAAVPAATSNGKLEIKHAAYFSHLTGKSFEVTAKIIDLVKSGKASVGANTPELGGDPSPWESKQLRLDFLLDGEPGTLTLDEGTQLIFPFNAAQLALARKQEKTGMDTTFVQTTSAADGPDSEAVLHDNVLDLTTKLSADGRLRWDVPPGEWKILRFGYTPVGIENHPSPAGGRGLEVDKLSRAAFDTHWAGFLQKVLDDIGPLAGTTLDTALIDSYEVGKQDWTPAFREEFKKRRGYDPVKYLPTFTRQVIDSPSVTERFLWDMRRTVADLFAENYFGRFAELCHQRGLLNATEPYTGPFESMQSGGPSDVIMGEFWANSSGNHTVKMVSSIAHTYGKSIVGTESFTAWAGDGKWQNDPYSLKTLGDLMFCQGVNRYIFHRYAMQPWPERAPGMTMGEFGFHFERTVTWWVQGKAWIDYITHCQFLLQQGRSVADVAYFTGESAPAEIRVGQPEMPVGYDYDAVNADVLLHGATVKNGRITLASGASYAMLVLPPDDANLTPTMLECFDRLVRAGATIIGPRPQHSPSLTGYPECDAKIAKLADTLWGKCDGVNVLENAAGEGRVIWGKSLADVCATQKLQPDFKFAGLTGDTNLAFVHRIANDSDIYFVSNQRQIADSAECTFRVSGKVPELWHPDSGVIEPAGIWSEQDGLTKVRLNFDPAGSVFVIFRNTAGQPDHVITATAASSAPALAGQSPPWEVATAENGSPVVKTWGDGQIDLKLASGKSLRATAEHVPPASAIDGAWNLSFPPNWGAPASVRLNQLMSWPDHSDPGVRYFSGTASYDKEIDITADQMKKGRELWLDLGVVKNVAEVSLNGHDLGVLWKPPFRVNVTYAAKPGVNRLVIKVTNLWPNRLIGDEQLPPDCEWKGDALKGWPQWLLDGKPSPTGRLTFTTWHHWKKDDRLLPSGLIGPVTLHSAQFADVVGINK